MMRALLLSLILLFPQVAPGALPLSDSLLYQGQQFILQSYPLERILPIGEEIRLSTQVLTSDNYRGYIATFRIIDNQLEIVELLATPKNRTSTKSTEVSIIDEHFPQQESRKLHWFSGLLICSLKQNTQKEVRRLEHIEQEVHIFRILNGTLVQNARLSKSQFQKLKKLQFPLYMRSARYKQEMDELARWLPHIHESELAAMVLENGNFIVNMDIDLDSIHQLK